MRSFEDRLLIGLTAYSLFILFATPVPPMTDFPTHMASAAVVRDFEGSPLREAFHVNGWVNSNRLFALLAGHTPRFVPMMWVGKSALSLWLLLPLVARRYLATWRPEAAPWSAFACLLSFSNLFNCGYIPYLIGIPLAALAASLPWAAKEVPPLRSLALPALLLALALYAHVLAFLAGAIAIGATALAVRPSVRSWIRRALVLSPSLVLLIVLTAVNRGPSGADIAPRKPVWSLSRRLFEKVVSVADAFITFRAVPEGIYYAIALAVLGILGIACLWARERRPSRGAARMGILLAASVLFFSPYFLGAERTDGRILPVAIVVWLGVMPAWDDRRRVAIRRGLLVLFLVPLLVWSHWNYARASAQLETARRALGAIPRGQIARIVFAEDPLPGFDRLSPFRHMQGYYVIDRGGFAPSTLFAHGATTWHPVSEVGDVEWRAIAGRIGAEVHVVIVGAGPIRDRVPVGERLFDDGRTIVVRELTALALGDALRPAHELGPGPDHRLGGPTHRLPLVGIDRPK